MTKLKGAFRDYVKPSKNKNTVHCRLQKILKFKGFGGKADCL
jgi:hypothetical protein